MPEDPNGVASLGACSCWLATCLEAAHVRAIDRVGDAPSARFPPRSEDELLLRWRKVEQPAVALPPPGLNLMGFRDPFVYLGGSSAAAAAGTGEQQAPQSAARHQALQHGYRMLLGSGVRGSGGALLAYGSRGGTGGSAGDGNVGNGISSATSSSSSDDCACGDGSDCSGSSLARGWRYEGQVCSAADLAEAAQASSATEASGALSGAAADELGEVWECPLLVRLPTPGGGAGDGGGGSRRQPWLLAVSPYPVKPPHSPSNPVLYWIGGMDEGATRHARQPPPAWCSSFGCLLPAPSPGTHPHSGTKGGNEQGGEPPFPSRLSDPRTWPPSCCGLPRRFDVRGAWGPYRLDQGDLLYAPNVCSDAQVGSQPPATARLLGSLILPR